MKKFILLFLLIQYVSGYAQIKNGPMVGYSEMKEVMLWVQTEKAAKVKFNYWEQDKPSVKMTTDEVLTTKKDGFTTKIVCDQVTMGKKYNYEVLLNNKVIVRNYPLTFQSQELWQYRKDHPISRLPWEVAIISTRNQPTALDVDTEDKTKFLLQ